MPLLSVLFDQQNPSPFFEIFIFSQDIWGNAHYVPEINLTSYGTPIKAYFIPSKTNLNKSDTRFCRRKTVEGNNPKINVPPKTPCTFLLFKANAFLPIFFPRNLLFRQF